jgi:hypothetical protein
MVVRQASPTVKPVEAHLTLSCRCIDVIFFGPKGHFFNEYVLILLNMESVYHIVTIHVNKTSWAHIWRLRSPYLGMGYDKFFSTASISAFIAARHAPPFLASAKVRGSPSSHARCNCPSMS